MYVEPLLYHQFGFICMSTLHYATTIKAGFINFKMA